MRTLGKYTILLLGLLLWMSTTAQAMPPCLQLQQSEEPLARQTLQTIQSLRARGAATGLDQPDPLLAGTAVTGSRKLLVILVKFSDHPSSVAGTYFDSLMFSQTGQSVWDYYDEASYGTLSIDPGDLPSVIGWQTAPQTYAYYTNGQGGTGPYPQNSQKLCEDLIAQIDATVDFSNYDGNNDGIVDGIVIIHSGSGAERTGNLNDIWSHKWSIWPSQVRDGKTISSYTIQPEYWDSPGDMTIGVYCHELGHLILGLPDLYDYDDGVGASRGLGLWSLMASGSWGGPSFDGDYPSLLDAWSRVAAGWVTPTVISAAGNDVSIPAVQSSPTIFKLWTDGGPIGDEYYLVENRQRVGYDTYLPGDGLLIYHVDDAVSTGNDKEWYPGHTSTGHYLVAAEQADGNWDLEKNVAFNYGDSGDPYPGSSNSRLFTAASTPSSDDYAGDPTYVVVSDISNSAATMTADFNVTLGSGVFEEYDAAAPTAFSLGQNYPNPFNPATRFEYALPQDGRVIVEVRNILGQSVRTLYTGYRAAGVYTAFWEGTDDDGRPVAAGVYFYRVSADSGSKTGKMILLK